MIKLLFFILAVGTFYNIGKTKSTMNGIIWAFLSFLVWLFTIRLLHLVSIRGFLALIIAIIMQFPLGLLEIAISRIQEKKRIFVSVISLLYNSLSSIFTLTLDLDFIDIKELNISVFTENEEFIAKVFNDKVRHGMQSFDFKLNNIESETYIVKIRLAEKEFVNRFAYFKGNRAILLKG